MAPRFLWSQSLHHMPQAVQRELKVCGGVGVAVGLCDAPLLAVFGVVPFLTSILSTMLPMLGAAKHDSMKVVFCCGKTGPLWGGGWVWPAHSWGGLFFQCSFVGGWGAFRLQEEGGMIRGRVMPVEAERALL